MSEDKHGSFLNGFSIGLFAGAAGYFLFGTNKGNDVRKQLATEWEKARVELEKDGVLEQGKSLRDMVVGKLKKTKRLKTKEEKKVSKKKFKGT